MSTKNNRTLTEGRKLVTKRPIDHLLVDLDGTLLGSNELLSQIDFFSKAIPELSRLTQRNWLFVLKGLRNAQREFAKPNSTHGPNNRKRLAMAMARGLGITAEVADQVVLAMLEKVFPTLQRHFFPVPGAKDFLTWAKEYYPMILATNPIWTQEYVRMRLDWAEIPIDYFRWVSYSDIMWDLKPTRRYYEDVLARENLEPNRCLLIGNDPKRDLPAIEVGIAVFLLEDTKELVQIKTSSNQAPAWKGTYSMLRMLLEKDPV